MANKYMSLKDSVNYKNKRFRVMFEGHNITLDKSQAISKGINGGFDVSMGAIFKQKMFNIRVRHTEPDTNYGSLSDLEYFYKLNDPNPTSGSGSNVITYTDHYGNVADVFLVGKLQIQTLTTILEGNYAWFVVPLTLLFKEPVA